MTFTRSKDDRPVITLDRELAPSSMRALTAYIRYLELTDGAARVNRKEVDALADRIDEGYWKKHKKLFQGAHRR